MAPLKDYLVLTELEGTGYVIDSYDSFEQAQKVSKELFTKYYHFQIGERQELFEKTIQCQTYKVNSTLKCQIIQSANVCSSDGDYLVAVICTNRENFSLKQLIMDREQTVYLFDLEDCLRETNRFIDYFPFLIAN